MLGIDGGHEGGVPVDGAAGSETEHRAVDDVPHERSRSVDRLPNMDDARPANEPLWAGVLHPSFEDLLQAGEVLLVGASHRARHERRGDALEARRLAAVA